HADKALSIASQETGAVLQNYTAAPFFYDQKKKGYHEWLVEFVTPPADMEKFIHILDRELGNLNDDYASKRKQGIAIERPVVREIPRGTFYEWLKRKGKLGGQHKITPLSNSRDFLEEILQLSKEMSPDLKRRF